MLDVSAEAGITWSAPALCDWLRAERGVEISADLLSELLHREGFRWKRTRDSKTSDTPHLTVVPTSWSRFLAYTASLGA
ncbi:winged helix-turn-helix domain-containing protein [Streptomyces sp. NPDC002928]|uniref:DUF397 domain-containing protein n=1 Tax=Streptomyces sp. NPDC002928 TaxID=3154440 RepID=UPI0033B6388B